MQIGIIAEGRSDQAVIANILYGKLKIDRADLTFIRPELEFDETDLSQMSPEHFSTWTLVKKDCLERTRLDEFLNATVEERYIVIHIDTAECHLTGYEVQKPEKNNNPVYSSLLRARVINRIDEWLDNHFTGQLRYAITIEEIEAWLLTIHDKSNKDTCLHNNPKKKLQDVLNSSKTDKERKRIFSMSPFERFDFLSREFRKEKQLNQFAGKNESLRLFCESLTTYQG